MTKGFNINTDPRESGEFSFNDPGGNINYKSKQCVHCGMHWMVEPGSGKLRGLCVKCDGDLCGAKLCITECVPYEAQIEILEGNERTKAKYFGTETERLLTAFVQQGIFNNEKLQEETELINRGIKK